MDVLQLDGVEYVKAAHIAKQFGYTSDYVGQLCRAEKISGHLVGRSWYVNQSDLAAHKSKKNRSSVAVTKKILKSTLADPKSATNSSKKTGTLLGNKHFYAKSAQQDHSYSEDSTELIPVLSAKKNTVQKNLDVVHADAKQLKIKTEIPSYKLSPTEKPKLVFKGALPVSSADSESIEIEEPTVLRQPSKVQKKAPVAVVQEVRKKQVRIKQSDSMNSGIVSINRTAIRHVDVEEVQDSSNGLRILTVSVLLGIMCAGLLLMSELRIDVNNTLLAESIGVDISKLFQIIRLKI